MDRAMKTIRKTGWAAALLAAGFAAFAGCAPHAATTPAAAPAAVRAEGLTTGAKSVAVAFGDVDGDGNADIVGGAVDPGLISIAYGDAGGRFSTPQYLPVEGDVRALAVADVNGDGRPDILYSVQRQSSGIRLYTNVGGRRWIPEKGPIEVNRYEGIRAADLNGDGRIDLVAANASSELEGGIQVFFVTGRGGFVPGPSPTVTGLYMDVAVADVNADGILDLIGAGWGVGGALRVWLGSTGGGGWSALPPVASGHFYSVATGDFDGDGRLDLVAGTYKSGVHVYYGDGGGGFPRRERLQPPGAESTADGSNSGALDEASFWGVLPVDLDGDGRLDLAAASLDGRGITAWRRTSDHGWQPFRGSFPATGTYYGLAAGDAGKSGGPVICGANFGEGIQRWSAGAAAGAAALREAFAGAEETPKPAAAGPRENRVFKIVGGAPEYKIGPGDTLEITLWEGNSAHRQDLLVRPDGRISFGLVENLSVAGLTANELDELLTAKLEQFFKRPRVDVLVKNYASKSVRLMGAVARGGAGNATAGEHVLRGRATVLEVLTAWGGPTPDADLKSVRIRRKDGETLTLNLYRTIIQGDLSQDMVLDDGDLIYLPTLAKEANRVYVFGEVQRPGAYTFSGSEMRLIDAISEAGGPTAFASQSDTKVVRGDITQPQILNADLNRLIEKGDRSQNMLLASGDLVYVPRSGFGDVKLFLERLRPVLELAIWPARVVLDWNSAADVTGLKK